MKSQFINLCFFFFFLLVSISFSKNPEWINYTNSENIISLTSEENVIWVCQWLSKFDGNTLTVSVYDTSNSELRANNITCIDY